MFRLIVCDGLPKSGSSFFYKCIQELTKSNASFLGRLSGLEGIIDTYNGKPTGFIHNPDRLFQSLLACPDIDSLGRFGVVKVHGAHCLHEDTEVLKTTHFITIRDPLDTARALLDQASKEAELRTSGKPFREAFLKLSTPEAAFDNVLKKLLEIQRIASISKVLLMTYPDFLKPSKRCADIIASVTESSIDRVVDAVMYVDLMSRSGSIWTEFNNGTVGRGAALKDLVQVDKLRSAYSVYNELINES